MDIGARLRHAREGRGLTIDALSKSTRVQPRILSAIEQNDPVSLPPRPYGRGFVRAFAAEVGLDPENTVRDFFSQFRPAEPPAVQPVKRTAVEEHPRHPWLWPVAAVLGYAAVGALVIVAGRWVMQGGGEAGAVGTSGAAVPPAVSAAERPAAPPAPAPISGIAVALEAQGPAWVTATVDGERMVYRTLQPGERVSLEGKRDVTVRTGDAGALLWRVNGRAAVPMGAPGEVKTARVLPEETGRVK
jgi:transcriptional regulator with XRE-family HTH domain